MIELAKEFLQFIVALLPPLNDLYEHIKSGDDDPEKEKQLMMNLIRKAKDEQARKEIKEIETQG